MMPEHAFTPHRISIAGGKGGVGVSLVSQNVGIRLCQYGRRVLLIDAARAATGDQALLDARLAPCESGDGRRLCSPEGLQILHQPIGLSDDAALDAEYEYVLSDLGDGLVTADPPTDLGDRLVLVTTPEPASVIDTYAALKSLEASAATPPLGVVVNLVRSRREAQQAADRIASAAREFLHQHVELLAVIPFDPHIMRTVRERVPLMVRHPHCAASVALDALARRLVSPDPAALAPEPTFWDHVAQLFL